MAVILKSTEQYRSVIQRYYKQFYKINIKGKSCEDQCILQHSNKICVITLAPRHPILHKGRVVSVNFQVKKDLNRLDNTVSGKGKRGAQLLTSSSTLCEVTCSTGDRFTLYSCIKGKLVEVNKELQNNPELLNEKPFTDGYIAVVLPKLYEADRVLEGLMTTTDYEVLLEQERLTPSAPTVPNHLTEPGDPSLTTLQPLAGNLSMAQPADPCDTTVLSNPSELSTT